MKHRNENRPGYTKTKVGWIPDEWECVKFSEVGILVRGPFGGALKKEIFVPTGYKVYEQKHAIYGDFNAGEYFLNEENYIKLKRFALQSDDIIMSCSGTAGRFAIVPPNAKSGVINQALLKIRPLKGSTITQFLFYFLNSRSFQTNLFADFAGGAIKNIAGMPTIKKIPIALPPMPEQNKIAEILSTWDEAIKQTRKLIEAKKRCKKALMQQLLTGKRRLQPYAKPNRSNSYRFFDLPEDWACPKIKEIAQECSERNTVRDNLPVLACSKHVGFVKSSEYFGKQVFSEDTSNYKIIRRGQFGFPSNHIEEGSIGLLQKQDIGLVSPIYTVFKCNENIIPEYLYTVFKTDTCRHIFKASTNASVDRRGSLRWKEFSLIHIPIPTREEQKAIANVLKTSDDEIVQIEEKLQALEKQKRGLMQKLLTGEVRVKL